MARLGWVVRPAEERRTRGRQKDGHRPAPVPRERDDGVHVHRVDGGALFAVDLDRHEVLVNQRSGRLVFEGLVLHDMAPVTGRVADGEQNGLVFFSRARESLVTPGIPVNRVARMLQKIRTGFAGETIHTGTVATGGSDASLRRRP